MYGDFNNSGTVSNNGSIKLVGTSAQAFPGSGTIGAMSTLEINNAAGITLNNSLSIITELKPTAGTLYLSNYDITLKSSATSTASVSALGGSASFNYNGTGRFVVERYINTGTSTGQHVKGWQLLAAPTQGGQTIQSSWMEGGANNSNPNPGYGIIIGGTAGTAGGFDMLTPQAVMKSYVSATNTWAGVGNPTTTAIGNTRGYLVFVRGDRSITTNSQSPNPTILRTRGTIQTGAVGGVAIAANLYESVGNPYPSAIDYNLITKSGLSTSFYLFDPTLQGARSLGGYQTINSILLYRPVPGGTSLYSTSGNYKQIQSGQAFFVKAGPSGGSLTFTESSKSSGSRVATRVANTTNNSNAVLSVMSTNLLTVNGASIDLADGNAVVFDEAYDNSVDDNDAIKPLNGGENFGIIRTGNKIAVEARNELEVADTIFYDMSNIRQMSYKLQFIPENLAGNNMTAELIDKYLNTRTYISLVDTNYINITTNANASSTARDRFMLVFRPTGTVPVTITHISANRNSDETISVNWKVDNEINIEEYQVERSATGNNFTVIGEKAAVSINGGSAQYSLTDLAPLLGDNFYRIKAISIGGQVQYSSIVKVALVSKLANIMVYPNPVINGVVNLHFTNQPKGNYKILVTNVLGKKVYQKTTNITSSAEAVSYPMGKGLSSGTYQLTIITPEGVQKVQPLMLK